MRALARWMKVTPSAMSHRAGWPDTVCLIADGLGSRWLRWSLRPLRLGDGPALPVTMAERHGVRAWTVVGELARSEAALGRPDALEIVRMHAELEEDALVQWWAGDASNGAEAGWVGAESWTFDEFRLLLAGLRLALASDPSLSASHAGSLVSRLNMC